MSGGASHSSYPEKVESILLRCVTDAGHVFVFPSEVVAESWEMRLLELGTVRAVRSDRFLSWDRLKERYFSPYRKRKPANLTFRMLFAAELLERGTGDAKRERRKSGISGSDFPFEELVNPDYPEQAPRFVRWISGLLPRMKEAVSLIRREPEGLREAFIRDMELLYDEYVRFLDEAGLFEPSWQEPDPREIEGHVHLFFPEIIEDFEEYRPLLSESERVSVHLSDEERGRGGENVVSSDEGENVVSPGSGAEAESAPAILRFSSARDELETLLVTIGGLLSRGVSPSDIAVTLPAYDSWLPYLREAAELRGIPLRFRSGSPLTSYPVGRLFRSLYELQEGGFSHSAMKNLFLDPIYPWRRRERWRKILGFGVEHSCIRAYYGPKGFEDPWKEKLGRDGGKRLKGLYEKFSSDLRRLIASPSFSELNSRMVSFLTSWFVDEAWGDEERNVLQYSLLQLREMAGAERYLLERNFAVSDPFSLWLSLLDQQVYVPTQSSAGVSVYRYRVAAGSFPKYHFIPGAGQEETRAVFDALDFLREDRRSNISEGSHDLSAPFLRAYVRSGGNVVCSCSDEGFGGPQLPPAEFLSSKSGDFGGIIQVAGTVSNSSEEVASAGGPIETGRDPYRADRVPFRVDQDPFRMHRDPFREEREFWLTSENPPRRLFPVQFDGYRNMRTTGLGGRGVDYTKNRIESPRLLEALFKVVKEPSGRFRYSPHSFDTYRGCGFACFLKYALDIESEDYEVEYENPLAGGKVVHRALQLLFRSVAENDGVFDPEKLPDYRDLMRYSIERSMEEFEHRGLDLFPPEWRRLRAILGQRLDAFLEEEARMFPRFSVEETETRMRAEVSEKIAFSGIIDRISAISGRPAVVDYKSGSVPPKKSYTSKEGLPDRSQMPIYLLLAERGYIEERAESGGPGEAVIRDLCGRKPPRNVSAVSYYSVKEQAYTHLLYDGPGEASGKVGDDEMHRMAERVAEAAQELRSSMEKGDFRVPESCDSCEFRSLCRVKYTIRSGS